jgi:hypothetical protein
MEERDQIFRTRLIALMTALNGGAARDPAVRRVVGSYAYKLAKEAGAKSWMELKTRASASAYDSLLKLFTEESESYQRQGDKAGVRGLEALALSLVARHQKQNDLFPGVGFLDRFIESCASLAKPTAKVVVSTPTAPRGKR